MEGDVLGPKNQASVYGDDARPPPREGTTDSAIFRWFNDHGNWAVNLQPVWKRTLSPVR